MTTYMNDQNCLCYLFQPIQCFKSEKFKVERDFKDPAVKIIYKLKPSEIKKSAPNYRCFMAQLYVIITYRMYVHYICMYIYMYIYTITMYVHYITGM